MTCFISYKEKQIEIESFPPPSPQFKFSPKKGGIHSTELITSFLLPH